MDILLLLLMCGLVTLLVLLNQKYSLPLKTQYAGTRPIPFETFVINLTRRPDRLDQVTKQLVKLQIDKFNLIKAIDAKLPKIQKWHSQLPSNKISIEEFACGLSHISVWNKIVDLKIPLSLIVEDDIVVPDNISQNDILDRIRDAPDANVILLGYCGVRQPIYQSIVASATCYPGSAVCLHAYIVSYMGAKKLLSLAKQWDFSVPIDLVSEKVCNDNLCYLSTSIKSLDLAKRYYGDGIIFQNAKLGSDIDNKKLYSGYNKNEYNQEIKNFKARNYTY